MILPMLAGGLLLWPRALLILFGVVAVALAYDAVKGRAGPGIIATIVVTAAFADVLAQDQGETRRAGAARRPDADRVAGPDPGPGQAARPAATAGSRRRCCSRPAGRRSAGTSWCPRATARPWRWRWSMWPERASTPEPARCCCPARSAGSLARCRAASSSPRATPTCAGRPPRRASSPRFTCRSTWPPATMWSTPPGTRPRRSSRRAAGTGGSPRRAGSCSAWLPTCGACRNVALLRPGDALMLYTDGLIEAPGPGHRRRDRPAARRGGPARHVGLRGGRGQARPGHAGAGREVGRLRAGAHLAELTGSGPTASSRIACSTRVTSTSRQDAR